MNVFKSLHFHTLSSRLVVLFIIMAIIVVILLGISMGSAFRANFRDNLRPHLAQYLDYIHQDIGNPPDLDKAEQLTNQLPLDIYISGPDINWSSSKESFDPDDIDIHRHYDNGDVKHHLGEFEDREYLVSRYPDYTIAYTIPHARDHGHYRIIPIILLLLILVALYQATRFLFSPIKDIKNGLEQFASGELNHRIQVKRQDELGTLSDSFNAMADDIQNMLEAKRQLLLAISHELRSPLTRTKVALEFIEDKKQREDIKQDLDEMEQLIEELLETERLSTSHKVLNKAEVSLKQLINDVIKASFEGQTVERHFPVNDIKTNVDAARLKLLVKNLLSNALKYTSDNASPPEIYLQQTGDTITLQIKDHGPGIDEQHIPHLTEPFYRVDPSRQRDTGGYGLGLYLCRVIAEAHGGSLAILSKLGTGTTIIVVLKTTRNKDQ